MCDGRLSASKLFCRLAGRGPFFRGFRFRWVLRLAFSVTRCLTLHDAGDVLPHECDYPCLTFLYLFLFCHMASAEPIQDPLYECGRPCDALSCLFITALWLRQNQSISTQKVQQTKDIDITCYKTLPTKSITCLQAGPMSCPLSGRWLYLQDLIKTTPHLPMKIFLKNIQWTLFHLTHTYVGDVAPFNYLVRTAMRVFIFLMVVHDVFQVTPGVSLGRFFSSQKNRELKLS